jgi:uncharacterized membrane protein YkvA (DUF1232 family)
VKIIGRKRKDSARGVARAMISNLPNLIRLLVRLIRDSRVSTLDKAFFGFVLFYTFAPADLIPDVFWMLGLFDDVYLIGLALTRLLSRAGPDILLEHWAGDPHELGYLIERVGDVGGLLPGRVRRTLKRVVKRAG